MLTPQILDLFARQYGVVSRRQLIDDFDIRPRRIARARQAGLLTEVALDVVRVSSSPETFRMRCMALQLQADETGFISAWSAGKLRELSSMPTRRIHFTVPLGRNVKTPPWADV
ncbi:MAG: hypothetical protein DRJ50_08960, partial [Actinobacteria bacterium]